MVWGYDEGDSAAHVTTNISPPVDGATIDFFFTRDVCEIEDLESSQILFEASALGQ